MQVGFIGLGRMGAGIAANLQKAGHTLIVHARRRETAARHLAAGAIWADTPRVLAEASELVFTCLPGPPEVEATVLAEPDGMLAGIRPDAVYFDLTTNAPALIRRLHAAFAAKGAHMLDAPISGGPTGAESGRMAIWVGGDRAQFDRCKPVLDAIGNQVRHLGPIGAGTVTKLANNGFGYVMTVALAEMFTLATKAGMDPLDLWQAVREGNRGRRGPFEQLTEHFLPNDYDRADFLLRLAHKDLALATALGREMAVPMRLGTLALEEITEAMNRGWGDRDRHVVQALQVERAGVTIAVEPERLRAAVAGARKD